MVVNAVRDEEATITSRQVFLFAYLHKPQKVFDARFSMSTTRTAELTGPAPSLVKSLHTGTHSTTAAEPISGIPQMVGRDSSAFSVTDIHLRCTAQYDLPGSQGQYLEIGRVYKSSQLARSSIEPGLFTTAALSEAQLTEDQGLWYEISIGGILDVPTTSTGHDKDSIERSLATAESWSTKLVDIMNNVGIRNVGPGAILEEKKDRKLAAAMGKHDVTESFNSQW